MDSYRTVRAAVAATAMTAFVPFAQAGSNEVSGHFGYAVQTPLTCGAAALLCAKGNFSGGIQGSFVTTILTLVPSTFVVEMVDFFSGTIVVTTSAGKLNCNLAGALANSGDGEFGEICVITGGSGRYAGASGHLQLIGDSTFGGLPILGLSGSGDYRGVIVTP